MTSGAGRMEALTGLRFVAAAWVVLYHFTLPLLGGAPEPLRNIVDAGDLGVDVFFVLSGFVLAVVYLDSQRSLKPLTFWRARFARVYPLFAFSVVLALLAATVTHNRIDVLSTVPALELAQAWGPNWAWNPPGWSLSVEALFYLLFPFIAPWFARLSRRGLFVALSVAWFAGMNATSAATGIADSMWAGWLSWWPPLHVHEFIIGICAGLIYRRRRKRQGVWLSVPAAIALIVLLARTVVVTPVLHNGLLSPLVAILIIGLAHDGGPLAWLLSRRPLVKLGEASYALYIIQAPLWFMWRDSFGVPATIGGDWAVGLQPVWVVLTFLVVLIAAALLVHVAIERPARRIILAARVENVLRARASNPVQSTA